MSQSRNTFRCNTCIQSNKAVGAGQCYDDQTLWMVDLSKFDPEAKTIKRISTKSEQAIADMSEELE